MGKYSFLKMNGAGNDFILINLDENPGFPLTVPVIRHLCNRRTGIGADGLLAYYAAADGFTMEYFNADGGKGSLCGNGSRSILWYHTLTTGVPFGGIVNFCCNGIAYSGVVRAPEMVTFHLPPPVQQLQETAVTLGGQMVPAAFADTGSPHVVINVGDIAGFGGTTPEQFMNLPVVEWGKEIRWSSQFAPSGTNVNFVLTAQGKVFIRTFERGVEEETLACGTGSTAAALVLVAAGTHTPPVTLVTFGGKELTVDCRYASGVFSGISLTGHAAVNFTGSVDIDITNF